MKHVVHWAALTVALVTLLVLLDTQAIVNERKPPEDRPAQYVKRTSILPDGKRQIQHFDPTMSVSQIVQAIQGGMAVDTCKDCWLSGTDEIEVFSVQQAGESVADKRARHEKLVEALQQVFPPSGECQ